MIVCRAALLATITLRVRLTCESRRRELRTLLVLLRTTAPSLTVCRVQSTATTTQKAGPTSESRHHRLSAESARSQQQHSKLDLRAKVGVANCAHWLREFEVKTLPRPTATAARMALEMCEARLRHNARARNSKHFQRTLTLVQSALSIATKPIPPSTHKRTGRWYLCGVRKPLATRRNSAKVPPPTHQLVYKALCSSPIAHPNSNTTVRARAPSARVQQKCARCVMLAKSERAHNLTPTQPHRQARPKILDHQH